MNRTPEMESLLITLFPVEMKRIADGRCPFCDNEINADEFRDDLSIKEWTISGLCQKCQDEFFVEPTE